MRNTEEFLRSKGEFNASVNSYEQFHTDGLLVLP